MEIEERTISTQIEIESLLSEIEEQKETIKTKEIEINNIAQNFFTTTQDKFSKSAIDMVNFLYWNKIFGVKTLSEMLNCSIPKLKSQIKTVCFASCYHCGNKIKFFVKNWEDFKIKENTFNKQNKRGFKYNNDPYKYGNPYEYFCETCAPKIIKDKEQKNQEFESQIKLTQELRIQQIEELKKLPYKEYLQTNHWKNVRLKALRYYNYKCCLCSSSKEIHIHHRSYNHRGEEEHYIRNDLIALCKSCHEKHHNITRCNNETK